MSTPPNDQRYPILQYFVFEHLSGELQHIARVPAALARDFAERLPQGPEVAAGLRHLLEAKDCFVRAALAQGVPVALDTKPEPRI